MIVTSGLGAICIVADHTSKAKRILFLGTVHTTLHHVDHYCSWASYTQFHIRPSSRWCASVVCQI